VRLEEREIRWTTWHGEHEEVLRVGFENGGWTAEGTISGVDVTYVIRFDADWRTRQFLLFRDLDEPDLWLATDGAGLWGETNGEARDDLTGCTDVALSCTPFSTSVGVKRLLTSGQTEASFTVAMLDVETLGLTVHEHHLAQLGTDRWEHRSRTTDHTYQFLVDEFGMVIDEPERFRRANR
jgi:uncharacterized protein